MSVIYKSVYKHSRELNDQSLEIAENFFKHGEAIGTRRLHKLIQELHYSRERYANFEDIISQKEHFKC